MVDVLVFHELVGQSPRMRPMRIWRWRSRPEAGTLAGGRLARSTWLGWGSLLAVGAVSEVYGEVSLEFFEDAVEAQAVPSAFGRVRRS